LDVVSNDLRKRQQRYKKVLVDCQNLWIFLFYSIHSFTYVGGEEVSTKMKHMIKW